MNYTVSIIAGILVASCVQAGPCEELTNANKDNVSVQDANKMVVACLKSDAPESFELAKYLKSELFMNQDAIERLTKAKGATLDFAKDFIKCHSDVYFPSKQDLVDFFEMGAEKYYKSRSHRSMKAHCKCEEYLSDLKDEYKAFYEEAENRECKQI